MAISYPLTPPGGATQRMRWSPRAAVGIAESEVTFVAQKQVHQGMRWIFEVELAPMKRDEAAAWQAFFAALNGQEGSFLLGDDAGAQPQGVATGTPVVDGASQSGRVLATRGWTASQTGILKAGDYIQLGSGSGAHLHMVVEDANSDGAGDASLEIWPKLRTSPSDGASITVSDTVGLFRLATNEPGFDISEALFYTTTFLALEDL